MPTGTVTYSPGTFGHFVQQHGYATIRALPRAVNTLARRLSERPGKVAPNSPMLPFLAEALKVPLAEIQSFAKAPPMSKPFVAKIQSQLARGTLPSGPSQSKIMKRHAAARKAARNGAGVTLAEVAVAGRREPRATGRAGAGGPKARGGFRAFVEQQGFTEGLTGLAKAARVPVACLWRLSSKRPTVAPNSPHLAKIANVLGVPVAAVARFATGNSAARYQRSAAPGTAIVHLPKAKTNGNGHAAPRHYNRLKKQEVTLRQAARDLVTSLNITIMQGQPLTPPLPTAVLHAILQDYLGEKGIKANVLVDPGFAALFDRS